jgi:hypothetical protein
MDAPLSLISAGVERERMRADSVFDAIGDTPLVELTQLSPADGAQVFVIRSFVTLYRRG